MPDRPLDPADPLTRLARLAPDVDVDVAGAAFSARAATARRRRRLLGTVAGVAVLTLGVAGLTTALGGSGSEDVAAGATASSSTPTTAGDPPSSPTIADSTVVTPSSLPHTIPGDPNATADTTPVPPTVPGETPATTIPGTPLRPATAVAGTADGRVVVLDTTTGAEVRQLAVLDDCCPTQTQVGPSVGRIVSVSLTADGALAFVEVCCELGEADSSSPVLYRVPTDGSSAPERWSSGPGAASPLDGRVAVVTSLVGDIGVRPASGASVFDQYLGSGEIVGRETGHVTGLTWTSDGAGLLWVRDGTVLVHLGLATSSAGSPPEVLLSVPAGERLLEPIGTRASLTVLVADASGRPTGERVVLQDGVATREADPAPAAIDRDLGAGGAWGLRVAADGALWWTGFGGAGRIAAGPFVAAAW